MVSARALVFAVSLFLMTTAGQVPRRESRIHKPISIIGAGTVALPDTKERPGYIVRIQVTEKENECGFADDNFKLEVSDRSIFGGLRGEKIAEMEFCSSYQEFDLTLEDLTGDGVEEFILVTSTGRGNIEFREEMLRVLRREGNSFKLLLSVPVFGVFGFGGQLWWYEHGFIDVNGDGICDLRLVRKHNPPRSDTKWSDISAIPRAAIQEYTFDPRKGNMTLYRSIEEEPKKDSSSGWPIGLP